jgi:hypothetical protein
MIDFRKGPLGVVVVRDRKAIGMIKDRRPAVDGWTVRLDGYEFDLPEVNKITGKTRGPYKLFKTFNEAKRFVVETLKESTHGS